MDLTVKIGTKKLPNPVGVASGTFGYGEEYQELVDLSKLGAIYTKAVTLEPRPGNPVPRMVETTAGMLNSIGLANVGVKNFINQKIPYLKTLPCASIVNVAGSSTGDYEKMVEALADFEEIWGFEINLSCPNVKEGCLAFGNDPKMVESLTKSLRQRTDKPLIIKLTPNVTDIASIAMGAEAGGADGISCINTLVGMAIDTKAKKPVLSRITGGLSGPAIKPVGLAATWKVAGAVKIPVVGMGGITTANDAIEYLLAGASAIQVGTANFFNPGAAEEILAGIKQYMENEKLSSIEDFHQFLF